MAEKKCNLYLLSNWFNKSETMLFDSESEQIEFFKTKALRTYNNCSYSPINSNMKIFANIEDLYNFNYLMIEQTDSEGNLKYYYCYITHYDYISEQVTMLTYTLDVLQTFMFDIHYHQCLIERAHVKSIDDTIQNNRQPEDFELGDYKVNDYYTIQDINNDVGYVLCISDGGISYSSTKINGFTMWYYDKSSSLTDRIEELNNSGQIDSIVYIFTIPKDFYSKWVTLEDGMYFGAQVDIHNNYHFYFDHTSLDGYIPKNAKLLQYPYNFLNVQTPEGVSAIYKFENFDSMAETSFEVYTVATQNSDFQLVPMGYNGETYNYNEALTTKGFGLVSWNNDAYANWYAQNCNSLTTAQSNNLINYNTSKTIAQNNYATQTENAILGLRMKTANQVTSAVGLIGKGNLTLQGTMSNITGIYNTVQESEQQMNSMSNEFNNSFLSAKTNYQTTQATLLASITDAQVTPNTVRGDTSACGLDFARDTLGFRIERKSIRKDFARLIDNYFQMYGYKLNVVDYPSDYMKTRNRWNYIKTSGITVSGNFNHNYKMQIEELFNTGITFYHDYDSYRRFEYFNN